MVWRPPPNMPEDELRRAKPVWLEGHLGDERVRLQGMTDQERAYRKQWLKDQELHPDEPKRVPELERQLRNPIRRLYGKPWDFLIGLMKPMVGPEWAAALRYHLPKCAMGISLIYGGVYYFKYNRNNWTRKKGWIVRRSRRRVLPGDPNYPQVSDRIKPSDYYDRGFNSRKVFLD